MGISNWQNINISIDIIRQINPSSILDIGCGFGVFGFLARAYTDVWAARDFKEMWRVKIDAIEIFEKYIQEHQRYIYDKIYIGDAYTKIDELEKYELIICGDVVEHMKKEMAENFIEKCLEHSNFTLIHIPIGDEKMWFQDERLGNEYEKHLSFWKKEDFEKWKPEIYEEMNDFIGRPFAIIVLRGKNG